MTECEMIIRLDSDDEIGKIDNTESPTSRSCSPLSTVKSKRARLTFPFGACRVCSDSATGIHYGIATCEGCKIIKKCFLFGFFKRNILRKEKYRCYFDNSCLINVSSRNRCKACRFRRCLDEGMSVDGVKMGRIPKLVKERALREQKEEQMRQEAALAGPTDGSHEVLARELSCSSLSDRSIENDDPNAMETDMLKFQVSPVQRNYDSDKMFKNNNYLTDSSLCNDQVKKRSKNLSKHDVSLIPNNENKEDSPMDYQTNYSTFLPDDFTLDETSGLVEHSTGPLSDEVFQHLRTISNKLSDNKSNLIVQLTDDESKFIRFLRWSAYNIYLRHSKRVKQLETRMNQMIYQGINNYPSDNATSSQFFATIPKTLEVIVRSSVFYIQELPGMTNMGLSNLHQMILHRSFDWYMLKYGCLLNENGQSYFLSPDGFQQTRHWMNIFYGQEMTVNMFEFSHCFRELRLNEAEISLVLPLQMCHTDPTMKDQETSRMLRACYLYALYEELCDNRGEHEGKILCSKILKVLDILIPLNEFYERNIGPRILEA